MLSMQQGGCGKPVGKTKPGETRGSSAGFPGWAPWFGANCVRKYKSEKREATRQTPDEAASRVGSLHPASCRFVAWSFLGGCQQLCAWVCVWVLDVLIASLADMFPSTC